MDCNYTTITTCELAGTTFRSRILDFGAHDISNTTFDVAVLSHFGAKVAQITPEKLGSTVIVPLNVLEGKKGRFRIEIYMTENGAKDLVAVIELTIDNKNCGCEDETSYTVNITHKTEVIPVTVHQAFINFEGGGIGGEGLSAYEVAKKNGFVGTEAQWLLSLKGDKGDKGDPGTTSWNGIADKPTSFPPSSHSHPITEVTGLQGALDGKENSITKNTAFNKNFGTTAGTVAEGNHTHNSIQTADGATRTFKEITKTAYDALATKDSSIYYIIVN